VSAVLFALALAAGPADDAVHFDAEQARYREMRRAMVEAVSGCVYDTVHARLMVGETSKAAIVKMAQDVCVRYTDAYAALIGLPPRAIMQATVKGDAMRAIAREERAAR
jgi:hypothetical protein